MAYKHIKVPTSGEKIRVRKDFSLEVPDKPIIPYIEGDGTGVDITPVMLKVVDAAVQKAYGGKKKIVWMEMFAGEKSCRIYGENVWLPDETLEASKEFVVSIKGPLTTPVGGGIRSINVALRQELDLYVCLRPIRYFKGVPSPLKGLGQLPSVKEIQSRAERLSQLEGLGIIEENGDAVILGGIEEHMGRSFQVRVSVDPRTGCTLRHQFIDPRWGTVVVDWSIPEWEQHADVFVPIRVEYRVLDAAIAPADQAAIRQAMEAAGLGSECSDPRSPRYNDWVEFRDRFFRLHGAPMAHAEKWQSCTTTLVAVNQDFAQDWLELPAAPSIDVIMSSALDCEVDQWDLAPNR